MDGDLTSVGHAPAGQWTFDDGVTACFSDMLRRSIPDLDGMRAAVNRAASYHLRAGDVVLDLGTAHGDAVAGILDRCPDVTARACECSEPMREAATRRLSAAYPGRVEVEGIDLRRGFPAGRYRVILCVLTLQFTPIEYRQRIVQSCFEALLPGGALLLVEKTIGTSAKVDDFLTGGYLALKAENGYSTEDIERKRLALEGVLVPVTDRWNEDMLDSAGFKDVTAFWRWFNFVGWVGVRR